MDVSRLCLYYRSELERDRWLPGDRFIRPAIRRVIRGKPRPGGIDKVFINLCLGLDSLGITYEINLPFDHLEKNDKVGVLGRGRHSLDGYSKPNPIVAGIGLMTHPSEWPTLCDEYPVVRYLQHSKWANDVYVPYFGERCTIWPVGINTNSWCPLQLKKIHKCGSKKTDILIYDKVRWEHGRLEHDLIQPIRDELCKRKLSFQEIRYGFYTECEFRRLLSECKAMIFLCEHESQGLAYQECLSSGVPVLAWDQGWCRDPNRFNWGEPNIPTSSVPYFDERCGEKFANAEEFPMQLGNFWESYQLGMYSPRDYILDNLTLEKCALQYLRHWEEAFGETHCS